MSENKAFSKGLRDEEVERGKVRRPPIPYIPTEDPIQETVDAKLGSKKFKVTLPDGTTVYHKVYDIGENEAFVIHVKEVLSLIKRKNYYDYYEAAVMTKEDCMIQFTAAEKKSNNSITGPTATVERAKALERSLELAIQAVMEAELHLEKKGKSFFGFYEIMLGEISQVKWARIVDIQVEETPWTNLQGNVHQTKRSHSTGSFRDCVKFHLLSVFTYDAAEHQKYYISHHLKKSRKVLLKQLNPYGRIDTSNFFRVS